MRLFSEVELAVLLLIGTFFALAITVNTVMAIYYWKVYHIPREKKKGK